MLVWLVVDSKEKTCFFITPIGDDDSPERHRSDQVLTHILKAVLEPKGFEVVRADQDPSPTLMKNIAEKLLGAELVVVDFTENNANVYYELGIRHCTGLPVIGIIEKGRKAMFDVWDVRRIPYTLDVEGVEKCKRFIEQSLLWFESNADKPNNPLTQFGIMQTAKLIKEGNIL